MANEFIARKGIISRADSQITGSLELDGTINGVLIGRGTGSDTANNTVLGFDAAANNTTGFDITAIGRNALLANTTGSSGITEINAPYGKPILNFRRSAT